ncbi:hypothetical protein RhiJN_13407 [Ceratobasidium sp. AG-Ba]|nr:hypothetical protein RhiJN_13407 [Ceratobasidium sp. AG-Ba]QRW13963.1 hypothetical protein RhiLY_12962 [Ceratobasidium sp. AG-Ba]
MTQIKQHEQRLQNSRKGVVAIAPVVRFRDMSDMLQPVPDADVRRKLTEAVCYTTGAESSTPEGSSDINSAKNNVSEDTGAVDPWDEEDSDDERDYSVQPGRDAFEFGEEEGVNLQDPCLLDLLSDKPVSGGFATVSSRSVTKKASTGSAAPHRPVRMTATSLSF